MKTKSRWTYAPSCGGVEPVVFDLFEVTRERTFQVGVIVRETDAKSIVEALNDSTRRFPIMGGPSIPWWVIEPHEQQAIKNHSQSLARLAERGGLSPCEALAVLQSKPLHEIRGMYEDAALRQLTAYVYQIEERRTSWRTIYTAPRDGTHILAIAVDESAGFGWPALGGPKVHAQTVVHWHEDAFWPSVSFDGNRAQPFPATHWQPLRSFP